MCSRRFLLILLGGVAAASPYARAESCCLAGQPDCNGNCIPDACDISCSNYANFCTGGGQVFNDICTAQVPGCGQSADCNSNGVPDECEDMVWYVDVSVSSSGCGTSWGTAIKYLQDALDKADSGDEIWVATGTYYPDLGSSVTTGDRAASFVLKDGVDIYGGFAGTESSKSQRSLFCSGGDYAGKPCDDSIDCPSGTCSNSNPTILSGDLDEDDGTAITTEADCDECPSAVWKSSTSECKLYGAAIGHICENSRHVVTYNTADANVILDGVTIRAGHANGTSVPENQGAGLQIRNGTNLCLSGGPTVTNCIIDGNMARDHGAANDHGSASSFTNCVFKNNQASKGGGLLVDNGSPDVDGCLFLDNFTHASPHQGGGAWFSTRSGTQGCPSTSAPTVSDSLFVGNQAMEGGAIWCDGADPSISTSTFENNEVTGDYPSGSFNSMGGAVFLTDVGASSEITDCTFTTNDAEDAGGAVFIIDSGAMTIDGCTFEDNATFRDHPFSFNTFPTVFSGGGAVWNENTALTISDSTFDHNQAAALTQYGGGLFNKDASGVTVESCSFIGNRAGYQGGGTYEEVTVTTYVNTNFVGNRAWVYSNAQGGAIVASGVGGGTTTLTLTNCSVVDNEAVNTTGGVYAAGSSTTVTATNTIFWDNEDSGGVDQDAQFYLDAGASGTVTYSIWDGYTGAVTTISSDNPLFTSDPDGGTDGWIDNPSTSSIDEGANDDPGDLTLTANSPAIDAGDNTPIGAYSQDRAGSTRKVDDPNRADSGDTGDGCPLVDIGAYEYQATSNCCSPSCSGGEVCCNGSCETGDCCADADCGTSDVCCSNVCQECCDASDCTGSDVCCSGSCQECCDANDCTGNDLCCSGSCQECCTSADCGPFETCFRGTCQSSSQ